MASKSTEKSYFTMAAIKTANRDARHHFFTPETLRFFDGRVGSRVYAGRYFLTSEQFRGSQSNFDGVRMWTIRACNDRGHISTVGAFQKFASAQAAAAAVKLLKWEPMP